MDHLFNFNKLGYVRGSKRPQGCILCLVAEGSPEVERLIVRDTGAFIVSLNLYPYNPGHLILFPRRHVVDFRDFDGTERAELDDLTASCLDALDVEMKPAGYNIGYNMGIAAGASIEHIHLHIIPRYPNEIGVAELISGARVLVQDPRETQSRLIAAFEALG
jgi:ATP adenylyltransferase